MRNSQKNIYIYWFHISGCFLNVQFLNLLGNDLIMPHIFIVSCYIHKKKETKEIHRSAVFFILHAVSFRLTLLSCLLLKKIFFWLLLSLSSPHRIHFIDCPVSVSFLNFFSALLFVVAISHCKYHASHTNAVPLLKSNSYIRMLDCNRVRFLWLFISSRNLF